MYRHDQEEAQWRQLALRWRGQEQRFEAAVEAIYSQGDGEGAEERDAKAMELLQARNELFELLMSQSGRSSLQRARDVLSLLLGALDRIHRQHDDDARESDDTRRSQSTGGALSPGSTPQANAGTAVSPAAAVGSPWDGEES
ncbi:hypothetical protein P43SY_002496 [Pythium insidiosum]|uniref:Uncharacterized protein n=1 Tax=Pythium insidiosum TaxID=114742 RepID=A0AAD5LVS0_PYTIN|nr:hypothetical protein P43SY_002496 [Pythium insidiosum]